MRIKNVHYINLLVTYPRLRLVTIYLICMCRVYVQNEEDLPHLGTVMSGHGPIEEPARRQTDRLPHVDRSEERRVGKECA